jgi:bifunctional DNase/RNase
VLAENSEERDNRVMSNESFEVTVKGVMPTSNGCAIFLGNDQKTFVIYVDPAIGNAINMTINQVKKERPLTHDLIGLILKGLETSILNSMPDLAIRLFWHCK